MRLHNYRNLPVRTIIKTVAYMTVLVVSAALTAALVSGPIVAAIQLMPVAMMPFGFLSIPIVIFGQIVVQRAVGRLVGQQLFHAKRSSTYIVTLAMASIPLFYCCACVGSIAWGRYVSIPFPSPAPYPGTIIEEVWRDHEGWRGYRTVVYEYTVDLSLNAIEEHYKAEMKRYCVEGWQFVDTEMICTDYVHCRTSECEIPRPLVKRAQLFSVYLRSISNTRTSVLCFEKTTDFW
jgi:hypothetical protein